MEEIKELIEKAIDKLKGDDNLLENFKKDPIKVVEKLLNVDLPDEKLEAIVDGIKAKLAIDDIGDAAEKLGLDNVLGKLGGLFGKKD
ncbi:MAG: hypothetical protein E7631_05355 [Ruminococcaceae bacterium]|nr:hypothetical protein [Oscillospiraceae bacterium]